MGNGEKERKIADRERERGYEKDALRYQARYQFSDGTLRIHLISKKITNSHVSSSILMKVES